MSIYKNLVIDESARNRTRGISEIPLTYSPKLASVINAIRQSQYYVVGGRDSVGKRSFVDLHFFFSAYFWWVSQPEPKPKLKILYFSMNKSLKMKLQKWFCTYLWLYFDKLIDINTLNGSKGKMYKLDTGTMEQINNSQRFFDYIIEESGLVEIFDGPMNPTGIYNEVVNYMKTVGATQTTGFTKEFIFDPGHEEQITLVIVDSTHHLKNESKSGHYYDENELHKKLNQYMVELRDVYKTTPVLIVPSFQVPGVYKLNQMKPDFREFRHYFEDCNVSLHLTNPFKLQMDSFEGYQMSDYMGTDDKIPRFRVLTIHRNTEGRDSLQIPMWFIPENGMFLDLPSLTDPGLEDVKQYIQTFRIKQISLIKSM